MTIGICILAHHHLYRVAELARHLAASGCKVAVHIDAKASDVEYEMYIAGLVEDPSILLPERRVCEWGTFGLHEAALESSRELIDAHPDVSHVTLISGSCLPIRPIHELCDFLKAHPDTDFVQSKRLGHERWVFDGLEEERFTLYHPFSWSKQRRLFDKNVEVQRRLGVKRRAPQGIELSIGSQWWTLTTPTLRAILNDPQRAELDRFFRKCWIVDESYVQTMVRRHSRIFVDSSLTLTEFDPQGKPFTFYDDHAAILENRAEFFARKVWHGANALYSKYLYGAEPLAAARRAEKLELPALIERGRERRCRGRAGMLSVSRFPCRGFEPQFATATPYIVIDGYDQVFSDLMPWLRSMGADLVHGRLFRKGDVPLDPGVSDLAIGVTENPSMRDWNPEQFLTSLIWHGRGKRQCFSFNAADNARMARFILRDPNATIFRIDGAGLLSLRPSLGEDETEFKRRADRLIGISDAFAAEMSAPTTRAQVHQFALEDVLTAPEIALRALGIEHAAQNDLALTSATLPKLRSDFDAVLHRITAAGIDGGMRGLNTRKPSQHAARPPGLREAVR